MTKNKYLPLKKNNLYYIYEYTNKILFPCSYNVYNYFYHLDHNAIHVMASDENIQNEIADFINILNESEQRKDEKKTFVYPKVNRNDIVKRLANTPNIVIEITEECNLKCQYCCYGFYYKKIHHKKGKDENVLGYLQTLLQLRIDAKNYKDFRISFYGGEPLVKFETIKKCVDMALTMMPDVNISFGITTNGILLDKYIYFLYKYNFHVLISLDGDRYNNSYRIFSNGRESFDIVVKNINLVYTEYNDYFKDYISFSSVLQGRNNFFDILKFFAKWKKVPVLSQVSSSGLKKNIKNHNGIWDLYKYKEREIEKFRKKYPILCNYVFPESTYNVCSWWKNGLDGGGTLYELIYTNNFKFPGRSCFLFSNKVFVTYNGELLICEKTSRKYLFGKISNKKKASMLKE